jgi:hypothetical protein
VAEAHALSQATQDTDGFPRKPAHERGAGTQTGGGRKQRGGSFLSLVMAAVRCSGQAQRSVRQVCSPSEHFVQVLVTLLKVTPKVSQRRP